MAEAFTCNVSLEAVAKRYTPEVFQNTHTMEWVTRVVPRFGHSIDQLKYIEENGGDQDANDNDYLIGLYSASIAVCCLFFVWILVVEVGSCCGVWTTRAVQLPPKPVRVLVAPQRIRTTTGKAQDKEKETAPEPPDAAILIRSEISEPLSTPPLVIKVFNIEEEEDDDEIQSSDDEEHVDHILAQEDSYETTSDATRVHLLVSNFEKSSVSPDGESVQRNRPKGPKGLLDIDYSGLQVNEDEMERHARLAREQGLLSPNNMQSNDALLYGKVDIDDPNPAFVNGMDDEHEHEHLLDDKNEQLHDGEEQEQSERSIPLEEDDPVSSRPAPLDFNNSVSSLVESLKVQKSQEIQMQEHLHDDKEQEPSGGSVSLDQLEQEQEEHDLDILDLISHDSVSSLVESMKLQKSQEIQLQKAILTADSADNGDDADQSGSDDHWTIFDENGDILQPSGRGGLPSSPTISQQLILKLASTTTASTPSRNISPPRSSPSRHVSERSQALEAIQLEVADDSPLITIIESEDRVDINNIDIDIEPPPDIQRGEEAQANNATGSMLDWNDSILSLIDATLSNLHGSKDKEEDKKKGSRVEKKLSRPSRTDITAPKKSESTRVKVGEGTTRTTPLSRGKGMLTNAKHNQSVRFRDSDEEDSDSDDSDSDSDSSPLIRLNDRSRPSPMKVQKQRASEKSDNNEDNSPPLQVETTQRKIRMLYVDYSESSSSDIDLRDHLTDQSMELTRQSFQPGRDNAFMVALLTKAEQMMQECAKRDYEYQQEQQRLVLAKAQMRIANSVAAAKMAASGSDCAVSSISEFRKPPDIDVAAEGGLAKSHYTSDAASRKRAIEEYVQSRKTQENGPMPQTKASSKSAASRRKSKKQTLIGTAASPKEPFSYTKDDQSSAKESAPKRPLLIATLDTTEESLTKGTNTYMEYERDLRKWTREMAEVNTRIRRMRIIILFAAFSVIASAIMFSLKGIDALASNLDDGRHHLNLIDGLMNDAVDLLVDFERDQRVVRDTTILLLDRVNGHCPNVREQLCVTDTFDRLYLYCNFTGLPLEDEVGELYQNFGVAEKLILTTTGPIKNDLQMLMDKTSDLDDQAKQFDWAFWVASACTYALAVICAVFICGVVLTWREQASPTFGWHLAHFILPMFLFLLLLAWVFTMAFIIGSTATTDFCANSPDERVESLLSRIQGEFESAMYDLSSFYVSGCPRDEDPHPFEGRLREMVALLAPAGRFNFAATRNDADLLGELCGADFAPVQIAASFLNQQLCVLVSRLVRSFENFLVAFACKSKHSKHIFTFQVDVTEFFSCKNWQPLYAAIAHEDICHDSLSPFAWAA
jgi:hypothetical protein